MPINSEENMVQRWSFTESVARWPTEPSPVQLLMRGRGLWLLSELQKYPGLETSPHTPDPPTHTHHIHTPMYRSEPQQVAKTAMGPAQWTCRKGQFAKRFWEVAVIISVPDSEMCILSSADFMSCYQDAAFQSTCMLAGMAFSVAPEEMRWFRFSGNLEKA